MQPAFTDRNACWRVAQSLALNQLPGQRDAVQPSIPCNKDLGGSRFSRRSVARRDWKRGRHLAVRLLRVHGMGHAWSGGAAGQAFSDPSGPDALRLAWQFFETAMEQAPPAPV